MTANAEFDLADADGEKDEIGEALQKLEAMIELNKYGTPAEVIAVSEEQKKEDKDFVENQLDQEYYTRVQSSDTFYRRKRLILENLELLEKKVKG